jgi:Ni,Fe-hydrogenase III small subunit/ferredoxin
MKRGLFRESVGNILSKASTEGLDVLFARKSVTPFVGGRCDGCGKCADACPSKAIVTTPEWTIDAGRCILCMECLSVCPINAVELVDAPDYTLRREDLIFKRGAAIPLDAGAVGARELKVLRRSVCIREVDTGSCNACEIEVNSLSNRFYDTERFGIRVVASPRHADALLVTGPLTANMYDALIKVVKATPGPKVMIAMGSCAISGGMFVGGDIVGNGIGDSVRADMFIPGCPPPPDRLIRALLSAFGRRPTARR